MADVMNVLEAESAPMTDVINMLESEPSSASVSVIATPGPVIPALREQLAILVSTGKAK